MRSGCRAEPWGVWLDHHHRGDKMCPAGDTACVRGHVPVTLVFPSLPSLVVTQGAEICGAATPGAWEGMKMCILGALEGAGVGTRLRISLWGSLGLVLCCPDLAAVASGDREVLAARTSTWMSCPVQAEMGHRHLDTTSPTSLLQFLSFRCPNLTLSQRSSSSPSGKSLFFKSNWCFLP